MVLLSSLSGGSFAQALSLDGNCSNWKVGTLTDSRGMNRKAQAKSICATLGKSGDAITVFDGRSQSCMLCYKDDWTPGSSPSDKTVQVPNVVGKMYRDAFAKLKEAGLKPRVGKASSMLTLNPMQKVLNQETTAGTRVSRGETVVLNFSKEGFKMPLTLSDPNLKKQPLPDVLTREQYNSEFGRRESPTPSSAGDEFRRSIPDHMNCEAGLVGLRTSNKKRVGNLQHGEVGVRKEGIADYICWYATSKGDEVLVKPSFFVKRPDTRESGGKGRNLIAFCDRPAYNDVYGVGSNGKAMKITIGKYSANKITRAQLQQLVNFHIRQMMPLAIPCSG
jgi:PASTA domain-containing protein